MPRERELEGSARDVDEVESLVDKLRSGQFSDAISAAQRATEAQEQMCLRPDGTVKKADPLSAFVHVASAPPGSESVGPDDDELKKLREARKAQLQKESLWKKQGHGSLRELADEKEFVETIAPHEQALLLLDDGRSPAGEECRKVLGRLAGKHLETQFCWLSADRAFFLTQMVDLEALPTIFALRYGEVVRHLPPSRLFAYSSASSPLFPRHLSKALYSINMIDNPDDDSASSGDSGDGF
ncbi:Txndc9 [Symbiodinium necroappetens]|uniref:Txndc9 protein n=1 Tax=Symbiodinium necroappetens TaxID=1628268 RepID=A0A813CIV6_9DINO|nr:Txndc9 [Symbiodinium necroappetens]